MEKLSLWHRIHEEIKGPIRGMEPVSREAVFTLMAELAERVEKLELELRNIELKTDERQGI